MMAEMGESVHTVERPREDKKGAIASQEESSLETNPPGTLMSELQPWGLLSELLAHSISLRQAKLSKTAVPRFDFSCLPAGY